MSLIICWEAMSGERGGGRRLRVLSRSVKKGSSFIEKIGGLFST